MNLLNPLKYLNIKNLYKETVGNKNPGNIIQKVKPLIKKKTTEIINELKLAREKLKDIPGTNYKLGLHHLKKGNMDDAILRFKMVTYLTPEMASAHYNLGRCLLIKGDKDKAKQSLEKALSLEPNLPEAVYTLGKLQSPELLDTIPSNTIAEHIEWQGDSLSQAAEPRELRDKLLITSLLSCIKDKNPNLEVLDLGCMNGGRGLILREKEVLKRISGVDIDKKSTVMAKKQVFDAEPVYSTVINEEISAYLANNQSVFDIVLAGNIFSYQGTLDAMFNNISRSLKKGGFFAAIINQNDLIRGYNLNVAQDKFIHSINYFEEILKLNGLTIEHKKEKELSNTKYVVLVSCRI